MCSFRVPHVGWDSGWKLSRSSLHCSGTFCTCSSLPCCQWSMKNSLRKEASNKYFCTFFLENSVADPRGAPFSFPFSVWGKLAKLLDWQSHLWVGVATTHSLPPFPPVWWIMDAPLEFFSDFSNFTTTWYEMTVDWLSPFMDFFQGGIRGVIWADVFQAVVLLTGLPGNYH